MTITIEKGGKKGIGFMCIFRKVIDRESERREREKRK